MGQDKAAYIMDYEEYKNKIKETFSVQVTAPDPENGHTHIAYVDQNGNGCTTFYPEGDDYGVKHQHLVVSNQVIPYCDGYSISFHNGLTQMSDAEEHLFEKSIDINKQFGEIFKKGFSGKIGHGIPSSNEKDVEEIISKTRKTKDKEIQDAIKKQ